MSCSRKFIVSKDFHDRNRQAIYDMVEHGGNTIIDFDQMEVTEAESKKGGYNYISMPRGVVDWHSHPQRCQSRDVCAVGLPSPADMINITLGAIHGTQVHLLYASEGTYCIRLHQRLKSLLEQDEKRLQTFCRQLHQTFESLHQHFVDSESTYAAYRRAWLEQAKEIGFLIEFFPQDKRPSFVLQFDCSMRGQHAAPVNVHHRMEQFLKASLTAKPKKKSRTTSRTKKKKRYGTTRR